MGKWFGKIGYGVTSETKPGVWTDNLVVRDYYGDVIKNYKRIQGADKVNDNITVSNQISIIADPFAYSNFQSIRFIEFMGSNWKVTDAEVQYPRLILTIGGVYNGPVD